QRDEHVGERRVGRGAARGALEARELERAEQRAHRLCVGVEVLVAAREGVSGLLGALGRLEAERFPPGPVPSSNPGARFTLTLTPRDATRPAARLEVGGACPDGGAGVYLVRTGARPVAACVGDAAARALELTEEALVDRHVVGAEAHDVLELKLTDASRKLELARREEGWHMRAPIDTQLSGDVVEGRLDRILALEGELLPATSDRAALGLAPPAGTARVISLGRPGGEERTELLNLGVELAGKVALERVEDGTLLSVDATAARALQPDSATLRALEIYTVELKWFRGLRLRARSQRQELRRDVNGAWTMLEPKLEGLRADPGLASELAERFGSLRAVGWNAEKADAAMGLDAPWCELEADVAEEGKPDGPWRKLRVSLGAPTEGGYFARHDDDPAVFVAPKGLGEAALGWLLDRGGLLVDLARVTAVAVKKGAEVLRLERKGAHLTVRSGPNKTEAAAAVVEDALRQLMAEGVVRLGPKDKAEGFDAPLLALELELAPPGAADPPEKLRLEVGAGEIWRETSVFYVRKAGLDATFAVAQSRLRPLSELF
ncbi:MAG: DUF4340 domain-containing protein, partial [Myxococcales bacterium]|nr:DUF4340 domain-containing protein [Myxococcales bacterium]